MGKAAKGSRKGKKAWRANIPTDDIEDFFEKSTKDTLAGADTIPSLPSSQLFQIDAGGTKDIPVQKKIEKKRERVLRCELIFQKNPFVIPVPSSAPKKTSKSNKKTCPGNKIKSSDASKEEDSSKMHDIWDNRDEVKTSKIKKSTVTSFPAVEVEPQGCSFNPPLEAHQDALAKAVADEMQKIYKKELGPQPVPLVVSGEVLSEVDKYFLDADGGDEDDMDEDYNQGDVDVAAPRKLKTKRVTRVELNRRARRKERLRVEEEAKKKKDLLKEIDSLPAILEEIAKEDHEKKKRHLRREATQQERIKSAPPRLGKQKFEPAPMQVLLSEEISGSIRKLKPCSTLARDRFKSLEKRGLLVPLSKKISKRRRR